MLDGDKIRFTSMTNHVTGTSDMALSDPYHEGNEETAAPRSYLTCRQPWLF